MRNFLTILTVAVTVILPNVFINGVDVSGLDADTALQRLAPHNVQDERIMIVANDKVFNYSFKDFRAAYDFDTAIAQAIEFSEKDGFFVDFFKKLRLYNNPHNITAEYSFLTTDITKATKEIADEINVVPKNATFAIVDGIFITENEIIGRKLDEDALVTEITNLLNSKKGGKITAVAVDIEPNIKAADFENSTQLLGSFSTPFDGSNAQRARNLNVANSYLNNTIIMPNEVMSACTTFRPRTEANGYVAAGQILHGVPDVGIGGGICQITSTLYMAALYAEMGIVERLNHSLMVGYMQPATDATVAEGAIDLKIKNNTSYPVLVQSVLTGHSHTVNIYGYDTREQDRRIYFDSYLIEIIPAEDKVVEDNTLPVGYKRIEKQGANGAKYELYKTIEKNGQQERVKINTSTYRPMPRIIKVGTAQEQPHPQ
ncbi:MAG: VanW family protein [Defluviitaleaceae bacterium]|nr:VanW family protein [Defluviitaleaceae bacterium]